MKMVAAKYDMPGKKGILVNGVQRINNTQVYAILAVMFAPKNLEEMQRHYYRAHGQLIASMTTKTLMWLRST